MACDPNKILSQELQNFNWLKEYSQEHLETELSNFDFPEFKTSPYQHQMAALLLGLTFDDFMFYLDMGLGKTAVMLYLIAYLRKHNKIRRALIIVPDVGNIDNWKNETEFHTHLNSISIYGDGTKKSKLALLEEDADVHIINYMGLQSIMTDLARIGGGKKRKRVPVTKMIDNVTSRFDLVVFDEIQNAGNPSSLVTELCLEVAAQCTYRYGLTGTPFGRDLATLWSQFYIVDGGRIFGTDFDCYQQTFFNSKIMHLRHASVLKYEFKEKLKSKIKALMACNSIIYDEEECNNLPAQIFTTLPIRLNKVARELYSNLIEEQLKARHDDEIEIKTLYSKLRQICSGFYYDKDEDTNDRHTLILGESPKINALLNIIEDMPPRAKLVVFHVFQATGDLIAKALKKNKIKFVNINHNAKDRAAEIRVFKAKPEIKVAVANLTSASTGLNLQVANYCVTYELHDDPRIRQQSLKRIHRLGQHKTTYYYDFVCTGTIEERVLKFLQEGKSLKEELMNNKNKAQVLKLFSK